MNRKLRLLFVGIAVIYLIIVIVILIINKQQKQALKPRVPIKAGEAGAAMRKEEPSLPPKPIEASPSDIESEPPVEGPLVN